LIRRKYERLPLYHENVIYQPVEVSVTPRISRFGPFAGMRGVADVNDTPPEDPEPKNQIEVPSDVAKQDN
jgi:hypothetical protein